MQPVNVEAQNGARKLMIAESQDEYGTLPALHYESEYLFQSFWQPSPEEVQKILEGRPIELWLWTMASHPPVDVRVNGVQYEGD